MFELLSLCLVTEAALRAMLFSKCEYTGAAAALPAAPLRKTIKCATPTSCCVRVVTVNIIIQSWLLAQLVATSALDNKNRNFTAFHVV